MIQFKSYSGTPGEGELARFMVEAMRGLGLEAFLQEVEPGRLNAIGRWRGTGGGKSLLFNGHLDTNPVTEGWTVDPWGGVRDDRFIYGIGVSNMKAGDAASFCAVKSLIDGGVRLRGDVVLTYVIGELQGGVGTIKAIDEGIRADYFVNSEPTDLAGLTLHAGAFGWVIELSGETRHMSKREEAVDALAAAASLVPRINALALSGAAGAEHASINRTHVGVLHGALSRDLHEWRPPQVADFARLAGSARYAPSQSEASVLGDFRRLLDDLEREHRGLRATVTMADAGRRPSMLPFEVPRTARIVDVVSRAFRAVRGTDQPLGPVPPYCFYGTDAAHLRHRAGMEGIVCGPGGRYNTMPDERVDVPDYLDMIKIYMLTMLEICEPA
ncbi:MAG: M20/M25/M40 family metallo-hydrolase [Candidatus Rokubacteria bacterium]|nr:M20/M25/M40 family metallo-hydrolase [Candidatus Rokubacteria bacterium]